LPRRLLQAAGFPCVPFRRYLEGKTRVSPSCAARESESDEQEDEVKAPRRFDRDRQLLALTLEDTAAPRRRLVARNVMQPRPAKVLVLKARERVQQLPPRLGPPRPRPAGPPRTALPHRPLSRSSSSSSPSPSSAMNGPSPPGRDHLSMDVSRVVMARASCAGQSRSSDSRAGRA